MGITCGQTEAFPSLGLWLWGSAWIRGHWPLQEHPQASLMTLLHNPNPKLFFPWPQISVILSCLSCRNSWIRWGGKKNPNLHCRHSKTKHPFYVFCGLSISKGDRSPMRDAAELPAQLLPPLSLTKFLQWGSPPSRPESVPTDKGKRAKKGDQFFGPAVSLLKVSTLL